MKRATAVSFAAALLAGAAGIALAPPDASAQQMRQYDRSNTNPYDAPDQGGPGDWYARQVYDQNQYGRNGFTQYDQPYRQYGQVQQYGPEDFGRAGRFQHYGSRSQYGLAPYDPDRQRMLQYGSRQQYGFPPYREGGGFQGQQNGQAMPGGDYRGPQGGDDYAMGQPGYAQARMGPYQPFGAEMRHRGPDDRQFGRFEGMPQRQTYAGGRPPEATYIREARREATGVPAPEQVLVTSANDLVGRTVRDMNGDPAGRVEFIMVDARSGDVSYAILGEGRGLEIGTDYVAVPWSAINVRPGDNQRITLKVGRDRLMQAPRLTEDDLAALASPAALTRVTAFYAVPAEEGSQAQSGQSSEAKTQQNEQNKETAKRDQQASRQTMQTGGPAHPAILVGRRVVTTLQAPTLLSPAQLRGNAVVTPYGEPVGRIDQVMLDLKRDHVAYLLLASGGFLGMDQVWIPIPFGSLAWSSEASSYVLEIGPRQLAAMPVLHKAELPTQVSTRHLTTLYRHYGVTPYWQKPSITIIEEGPGIGHPVRTRTAGMGPDEVREILRRQGFTEISDLVHDGDSYQATARLDGQQYDLEIDARNGIVFARGAS